MTAGERHFRRLERMYAAAPTNEYYRPSLRVGSGWAEVALALRPDFHHAAGAVHGSVYFKALDDAAFFAANSLVEDVCVLTASFQLYFLEPVSEGSLLARGRVVHRSRRGFVSEARLLDGDERELARGSGSFRLSSIPLSGDIGYA